MKVIFLGGIKLAEGFLLFIEIMLINIVLSGDNAVVIAMASKNLPQRQRKKAIWWGTFAAISLRIVLTVAVVLLLKIPYIQAAGSLLLLYISIKLLLDDEGDSKQVRQAATLGNAIWTIMAADFIMSLDNVLAIAAVAQDNYLLIALGVMLSIPLIIWGSTVVMKLLHKYPLFMYIGSAILGYTAGQMFVGDSKVADIFAHAHSSFYWVVPVVFTGVVILSGWTYRRARP
jgi:YjbE family integral membrane protein